MNIIWRFLCSAWSVRKPNLQLHSRMAKRVKNK
jgi:hypothetical protein